MNSSLTHISDEQAAKITDGYKNSSDRDKIAFLTTAIYEIAETEDVKIAGATLTAMGLPVPERRTS